jgi:hypothetical protein
MKAKVVASKGNLNTRDKINAANGKMPGKIAKPMKAGSVKPTMKKSV